MKRIITITILALSAVACRPTSTHFVIYEDSTATFDAQSGDTVDIIMNGTGDMAQRCADWGGVLESDIICRNVDF